MSVAKDRLKKAIRILERGGIVIYPTDTAFGIGCRIDKPAAVKRLFKIRNRPLTQAVPVLVDSQAMALAYFCFPSQIVRRLMKDYWPGALTIVAPCQKDLIFSPIRGGGDTLGLRMPNHEVALKLIQGTGVPILGPSANFHGRPTPYCYEDLDRKLVDLVDLVVPGECRVGKVSTVVDCSVEPYRILRQGAVQLEPHSPAPELVIDTSQTSITKVSLIVGGKLYEKIVKSGRLKSQTVLPLIEELLKAAKITLSEIKSVRSSAGPGSFTGLRVGFAVARMLGSLLGIPVNGQRADSSSTPVYGKARFEP